MKKSLAVGIEDFKEIIENQYYYVDKTLFIKRLIDNQGKVHLFTRPRRFGKTLTLSMLRTFFEIQQENQKYFQNLKIMKSGEKYKSCMGKFPIIHLSLKSARQPDFESAYEAIVDEISLEYKRHRYILENKTLMQMDKEKYEKIMRRCGTYLENATSLAFLSRCLCEYHHEKVIILMDEYDVPLEHAYFKGYYEPMIDFIRSLAETSLKTNESLAFAVITGCLRISKESIFTGLNNLETYSILDENYAEYFGFTPLEVVEMLEYYHLEDKLEEAKKWYDGYIFGNYEVYNPWSILNYVKALINENSSIPKPYWANTSANKIVRTLIEQADMTVKMEIEELIAGNTIQKKVHENITYEDINKSEDNLWNFLLFTGYLKKIKEIVYGEELYTIMAIPNLEVKYIYKNTIWEWIQNKFEQANLKELYQAIMDENTEKMSEQISEQLLESISFYDYAENYYHGFLAGVLKGCPGYIVLSNRESGEGRPDIVLKTPSVHKKVIIMELKIAKNIQDMDKMCDEALKQIETQQYEEGLRTEGYQSFVKYGVVFCKKECLVKKG